MDNDKLDAERYRWLRDNAPYWTWSPSRYNSKINPSLVTGFSAFNTGYLGFDFESAIDEAKSNKVEPCS